MIVKELTTLGFSEQEADLMDYIFLHPNCSVQDIVRDTNFRQPEVSMVVKNLGAYIYRDLPKHEGKGRRAFNYSINPKYIAGLKEAGFRDYILRCEQALQNLRSLKTESS